MRRCPPCCRHICWLQPGEFILFSLRCLSTHLFLSISLWYLLGHVSLNVAPSNKLWSTKYSQSCRLHPQPVCQAAGGVESSYHSLPFWKSQLTNSHSYWIDSLDCSWKNLDHSWWMVCWYYKGIVSQDNSTLDWCGRWKVNSLLWGYWVQRPV